MLFKRQNSIFCKGLWLFLYMIETTVSTNAESGCDPVVDLLFVLDTSSNLNSSAIAEQTNFVRSLLVDHKAPEGALRTAVMTCGDVNVTATPFNSSYTSVLRNLEQSKTMTDEYAGRHCLDSLVFKFKTEARAAVSRIAVIVRGSWNWHEAEIQRQADAARKENVVLVVVAVGIRDFGSLSAMQILAYNDATFFVVAGYKDLKFMAKNLSKGSCKPISLELVSDTGKLTQTTQAPATNHKRCIKLSHFMYKRLVPGFGYTRHRCQDGQTLDLDLCRCT